MKHIFLILSFLFAFNAAAQAPAQIWSRSLGGTKSENISYVMPTSDGHFLAVGTSQSLDGDVTFSGATTAGRDYVWAVKLASDGSIVWKKLYNNFNSGRAFMPQAPMAVETSDGYVIAFGYDRNTLSDNSRFKVAKTTGNVTNVGFSSSGTGSTCIAAKNGSSNFLLGGQSNPTASNAQIHDIDNSLFFNGSQPLTNFHTSRANLKQIIPISDGYLLVGNTTPLETPCPGEVATTSNIWVCKLNATLSTVWSREYGGSTADILLDAELRSNGTLVVLGRTDCTSGNNTTGPQNVGKGAWLMELNTANGDILEMTLLPAKYERATGFALLPGCDSDYVLCGISSGSFNAYVSKIRVKSAVFSDVWTVPFNATGFSIYFTPADVKQTPDGKLLLWGNQYNGIGIFPRDLDYWVALFAPDNVACLPSDPCADAEDVACGSTIQGSTATPGLVSNGRASNYQTFSEYIGTSAFNAPDRAYRFTFDGPEPHNIRIKLNIQTAGADLDMFLFKDNCNTSCVAASIANNESSGTYPFETLEYLLQPGTTYYLVVDGYAATEKGDFTLSFDCDCACACTEPETDQPNGYRLLADNFSDWQTGNLVASQFSSQSSRWRQRNETATTASGQIVSENGNNVLRVVNGTDLLYETQELDDNRFRVSWRMFVETGKSAYYEPMVALPNRSGNNGVSAYGVRFNANRTISITENGSTYTVNQGQYPQNVWMNVTQIVDLAADSAHIWIDGKFIKRIKYSAGANTLKGIRFLGQTTDAFRVDDLCIWGQRPCPTILIVNDVICTPGGERFNSENAARCDLYTSQEFTFCANVCDVGGITIQRGSTFSGKIGPSEAPALALQSGCVQSAYNNNLPPQLFGEVLVFYNEEEEKQVNFALTGTSNPQTKAFVFSCDCEGNPNVYITYNVTGISENGCGQACLGTLQEFNDDLGQFAPKGFYYVLILSPVQENYNIAVIPEGPCGSGFTTLRCGSPLTGTLVNENNSFSRTSPAYKIYNGFRDYTGRDKIYTFVLERPTYVDIRLTAPGPMGFFLFSDICGANPVTFAENPNAGGTALLDSFFLSPGIYFLAVDERLINSMGSASFNLRLDCVEASVTTVITHVVFQDVTCPKSNAPPHEVNIPSTALGNLTVNDFIQFQYRNETGALSTADGMGKYWNGGSVLPFLLPEDVAGDTPKCAFQENEAMEIAITRFDNASYNYSTYAATFQPNDPASGINAAGTYRRGGKSGVARLTPVTPPATFQVNPNFLNPPHTATTLSINIKANFDWIIEEVPDVPWITIPVPTGEGTKERSIVFSAQSPGEVQPREALLRVRGTAPGFQTYVQLIRVVQRGECKTPTVSLVASPSPACSGALITLTATPGPNNPNNYPYTYAWSNGKTGRIITDTKTVNTTANFAYGVTVTDQNCSSTAASTVVVAVNPTPALPQTTVPLSQTYCTGSPAPTLSVAPVGGVSVFWFNSVGTQVTPFPTNTFSPSAPGRYAAEPRIGACKGPRLEFELIQVAPPSLNAGVDMAICRNQTAPLNGVLTGGANGVRWSDGGAGGTFSPNNTVLNPIYTPANGAPAATLTLTTIPAIGCVAVSDQLTLTVKPVPAVLSAPKTLYEYCKGNATPSISVNTPPVGVSIRWYKDAVLLPQTTTTFLPTEPGIYVAEPVLNDCAGPRLAIEVREIAFPTVNAGADASSCGNQPAILLGQIGGGAQSAQWSDGNIGGVFLPSSTALNVTYQLPAGAQNAVLRLSTVSNNGCPSISDEVAVSRKNIPPSPTTDNVVYSFCAGNQPLPVSVTVPPNTTVLWTDAVGNTLPSNNNGALFNPPGGGVFLAASRLDGCSSPPLSIEVRQQPAPAVNAGPVLTSCSGQPVTLAGTLSGAAGAVWSASVAGGSFQPNANALNAVYTPPAGFTNVVLRLTTLASPGCAAVFGETTVTASSGNSNTPEQCGNNLDDDCDGFVDETGVWREMPLSLTEAALTAGERLGFSAAITGEWAVVGAPFWNSATRSKTGRVLLYRRAPANPEQWSFVKSLIAADGGTNDNFGYSVSIHGNYVLAGAPNAANGLKTQAGAAYLFSKDQGGADNWGQLAKLTPATANVGDSDFFGRSVSISGDYALVGAQNADDPALTNSGAAYLYYKNQNGNNAWGLVKRLKPLDPKASENFGAGVVLDGETLAVGAPGKSDNGLQSGAAYVFAKRAGGPENWEQTDKLLPATLVANDRFGSVLALKGNWMLAGAPYDDAELGSVFVYERNPANTDKWLQRKVLTSSSSTKSAGDRFGFSLALGEGYAMIGTPLENTTKGSDAGAVYVFHRTQGGQDNWGSIGSIQASDGGGSASFGSALAFENNTLIVGSERFDAPSKVDQGKFYVLRPGCGANRPDPTEQRNGLDNEITTLSLTCAPVPFGATLRIKTETPMPGGVEGRLVLRDVLGRTVALIFEGTFEQVQHFASEGTALSPGLYYVVWETTQGNHVEPVVKVE